MHNMVTMPKKPTREQLRRIRQAAIKARWDKSTPEERSAAARAAAVARWAKQKGKAA